MHSVSSSIEALRFRSLLTFSAHLFTLSLISRTTASRNSLARTSSSNMSGFSSEKNCHELLLFSWLLGLDEVEDEDRYSRNVEARRKIDFSIFLSDCCRFFSSNFLLEQGGERR